MTLEEKCIFIIISVFLFLLYLVGDETLHIAVIPGVGFSHLTPSLEFSKLLVEEHQHLQVTCLVPSLGPLPNSSKAYLQTLPPNINPILLPPVDPNDLPQDISLLVKIHLTLNYSMPSIRQALKSLTNSKTSLAAMVIDSFAFEALDFAIEFHMLSYIYYPAAATTLAVLLHLPNLDEETLLEYKDWPHPIEVRGCVPFHGRDFYSPAQDRTSLDYKTVLQRVKRMRRVDGIFINSFLALETGPIAALQDEGRGYPRVYPVGPIVQTGVDAKGLECITWLDKQEVGSVLYISFGSGGTLSQEQINELAYGLELSNHQFLWVFRAPSKLDSAAYLGAQKDVDPLQFLPRGFLEKTKEKGLVVPSWVPQVQVLKHSSVGGFLTHCGWNSILESVQEGVPFITWPLFAEQSMNAVLLSEGLKVGVRPRVNENGLVEREEIVKVIKHLMEGEEGGRIRKRMEELKEAANDSIKEDGFSAKTLSQFSVICKNLTWNNWY